jgi:hypothetical protein
VENPATNVRTAEGTARPARSESDPVVLALPPRRAETEACLQQLQAIETGSAPKAEFALLVDLLTRSPGLTATLADPTEVRNYHHPLASVQAYKHRMHALRVEYAQAQQRIHDLEIQLDQAHYHIEVLRKHVQFLDATLERMRASRAWKTAEKCSHWLQRFVTTLRCPLSAIRRRPSCR